MMAVMLGHLALRFVLGLIVAAAALAVPGSGPAHAQYYDLYGAYRCLTAPDAACKVSEQPPPPLPPPPVATPTVEEVIGRIRLQQVTQEDIGALETRAAAKEARAVEALAWCKLNGIVVTSDPVAAYFLYGDAAQLGIPTAKSNQSAIFETRLTPEQRQLVLMREQAR